MREYGKVFAAIWRSDTFRALSEDGRSLVLYLLTCQHQTIAGVCWLPDGYVGEDLQWAQERVSEGFRELSAKGFAKRCETSKWVWVCKFLEWNPPENPNQRKAMAKMLALVPAACSWLMEFHRRMGAELGMAPPPQANPTETVPKPLLNQEQEQEQEQEKNPPSAAPQGGAAAKTPRATRKVPAGFEVTAELKAWAEDKRPDVDIEAETEKFRDHTFGNPISDWPGAWRNWMRRANPTPAQAQRGQQGQPMTFRERDEAAARADFERLSGRTTRREVIDITPCDRTLELPHA